MGEIENKKNHSGGLHGTVHGSVQGPSLSSIMGPAAANVVNILGLNDKQLLALGKKMLLSLNREEMLAIQAYFKGTGRNPTDAELETIAQTWSEHCKHKVMNAEIEYTETESAGGKKGAAKDAGKGVQKRETIDSLFRTYIKRATEEIEKRKPKFLVSVFSDNAGIISFTQDYDIAFKVETHNHPSALDPYGGASTGIGGVIRDILGCGMGAKPIANTDIFCFGPHDFPRSKLPKGVLHPKRIAKGVRAGVRDYGNRMGIPTLNGAILFDERYIGNPLVYCGTVGIIPRGMQEKRANFGDLIVAVGASTGRDGIHGATFSSAKLGSAVPPSVVQIGNAIEEKKFLDILLKARGMKLYSAITDCGAGGFSSAVGEMAASIGARVQLEKAPLKARGILPWEIWVSESQERMVLAVPPENLERFSQLCAEEDVQCAVIGKFNDDKVLRVFYGDESVCELEMDFLHKGVPKKRMKAVWKGSKGSKGKGTGKGTAKLPAEKGDYNAEIISLLSMPNIASKESTIRQYDHEVQAGSVVKPLAGADNCGPSDAAVIMPVLGAMEGVAIACGINPLYGDIDPYWMAACAIDEAIRNLIAVGCPFEEIALLDNFCWGNPEDAGKLAELVRACRACYDFATAFDTPFISGKDSFYNEYTPAKGGAIAIPSTLLISAAGIMGDVRKRVTMDFKGDGNPIYIVGETKNELGCSHYARLQGVSGGEVPEVDARQAKKNFLGMSRAAAIGVENAERIVRACHDCSEGGIAVALAEMCIGGGTGAEIELAKLPCGTETEARDDVLLFSESQSRFVVEVNAALKNEFEKIMRANGAIFAECGKVTKGKRLVVLGTKKKGVLGLGGRKLLDADVDALKAAWKKTLDW
ncbi:MAG: phosphoribosylformylglycinamidine synthase subunit PurL [Candidatus Diapherotrites archaeon]